MGSERVLDLPAGSVWKLTAMAPGLWLRSFVFAVGVEPSRQLLRAYSTGMLTGKIVLGAGASLPEELVLRFQSPPGETAFGVETAACPIGEEGAFRCILPRGMLDLRLGLRGFAPHYRWGVALRQGETTELGSVRFVPGASLSGTVVADPPLPPDTAVTPFGSIHGPSARPIIRILISQAPSSPASPACDMQNGSWL